MEMTFREFSDRFYMSDEACDVMGLNPYCLAEGLADYTDTLEINKEQAQELGIHKEEFQQRSIGEV